MLTRVASNTSPISNLAIIGRLDLLKGRYGVARISPAVAAELSALSHPAAKAQIAAALCRRSAQCSLGCLHFQGLGVEKNMAKAFELFTRAVEAENTTAMFNLALLHLDPDPGHHDTARAASLLKKCALEGFAEARELLEEIQSQEAHGA